MDGSQDSWRILLGGGNLCVCRCEWLRWEMCVGVPACISARCLSNNVMSRTYVLKTVCHDHVNWSSLCFRWGIPVVHFQIFNLLQPTGHLMHQQFNIQQLYVLPTLYLCVLYLSGKKTATCATYSINWLVFITEMKSVYCAVRTGSLNIADCASSSKG